MTIASDLARQELSAIVRKPAASIARGPNILADWESIPDLQKKIPRIHARHASLSR